MKKTRTLSNSARGAILASAFAASLAAGFASAAEQKSLDVVNVAKEPLAVEGPLQVTGAGGLRLPSLVLGPQARLVIDPIRTPVAVAAAPSFAEGAKISLAKRYAGVKRGRIVLATWSGEAKIPADIFDKSSVAGEASVAVVAAPDGESRQLVVTVGDYDASPRLRILAIGDSITQGVQKEEQPEYGFPQYRTSLASLLAANGTKAVMIGSRVNAQLDAADVLAPRNWTQHYGVSGETTGGMLGRKDRWSKSGEPDVVTLLIGTNDIHGKRDAADKDAAAGEVYDSWKKLIDEIAARWPDAAILGATILDRDFYGEGPKGHDMVVRINDRIKADFKAGRLPKNFVLVDLFEKCPLAEDGMFFADKLHPNWKGQMAIAEAFYSAIPQSRLAPAQR